MNLIDTPRGHKSSHHHHHANIHMHDYSVIQRSNCHFGQLAATDTDAALGLLTTGVHAHNHESVVICSEPDAIYNLVLGYTLY